VKQVFDDLLSAESAFRQPILKKYKLEELKAFMEDATANSSKGKMLLIPN